MKPHRFQPSDWGMTCRKCGLIRPAIDNGKPHRAFCWYKLQDVRAEINYFASETISKPEDFEVIK